MLINLTEYRKEPQNEFQDSKKSYSDRLKALNLPTLKYRRYRGDMIGLFRILKGIYDPSCVPQFDLVQLSEETIRTGKSIL